MNHPALSPSRQLSSFLNRFEPHIARLVRALRRSLRREFPAAVELVYDNYNALAIGLGPNERTSEAFVSIAVYARGVNLYFLKGAHLKDPGHLLQGAGKQGRFIRLESPAIIEQPAVRDLLRAAVRFGKTPFSKSGKGYTVIKSISTTQRSRKPL